MNGKKISRKLISSLKGSVERNFTHLTFNRKKGIEEKEFLQWNQEDSKVKPISKTKLR
ncbi:MAG: hypothetical protein ACJAS4_000232 [Bacteriovoracaceae bacterium]|jgi:hypothetical protein